MGDFDCRAFTFDEVKGQSHWCERQEQIREENGRVNLERVDGLQRHRCGKLRRPADFEQRVFREARGMPACIGRPAA
jgi:hypothetical protein